MSNKNSDGSFKKITELYAFIVRDGSGEGIMAFGHPPMPMIGADVERVNDLIKIATEFLPMGKSYCIKKFKLAETDTLFGMKIKTDPKLKTNEFKLVEE